MADVRPDKAAAAAAAAAAGSVTPTQGAQVKMEEDPSSVSGASVNVKAESPSDSSSSNSSANSSESSSNRGAGAIPKKSEDQQKPQVNSFRHRRSKSATVQRAEAVVEANPWDVDAWTVILLDAQDLPMEAARDVYERLLVFYPTSSLYWKVYCERELQARAFDRCEKLFQRCLLKCPDLDLWKVYIDYIRTVKKGMDDEQEALEQAFDFVLDHMGMDVNAAAVWKGCIQTIKKRSTSTPYEESVQQQKLRKVYQRAVSQSMFHVEDIWSEYDQFETRVNVLTPQLAKTLLSQYQQQYLAAKKSCRERKKLRTGMVLNILARPPAGAHTAHEYKQVELWSKYLHYEQSNPLKLTPAQCKARVLFATKQALLTLWHYPEVWNDAALYCSRNGFVEDALMLWKEGCGAMPDNTMLHFMYSEWEERRGRIDEARAVLDSLIVESASSPGSSDPPAAKKAKSEPEFATTPPRATQTNPLVFIQRMRFARRCESVDAARKVFVQARRSPSVTHHVFLASAELEHRTNNAPKIAQRILAYGLDKPGFQYFSEPAYVMRYLEFLWETGDHKNLRVLCERIFASVEEQKRVERLQLIGAPDGEAAAQKVAAEAHFPLEAAAKVWDVFVRLEQHTGDLEALTNAQFRKSVALGHARQPEEGEEQADPMLDRLSRWQFMGLYPTSEEHAACIRETRLREQRAKAGGKAYLRKLNDQQKESMKKRFPRPDLSTLIEYQPGMGVRDINPKLWGNGVPLPDQLTDLLTLLPSSQMFTGPYYDIDRVVALLRDSVLPTSVSEAGGAGKRKRDDASGTDLYRRRQQQKARHPQ